MCFTGCDLMIKNIETPLTMGHLVADWNILKMFVYSKLI